MQREHEETMRADFDRYADLADQIDKAMNAPGPFDAEQFDAINGQQEALRKQWQSGPHSEQWEYLSDARDDWRSTPDTMSRFYDNVAHNDGGGLDEVQLRSLSQAAELTARSNERRAEWQREARAQRSEQGGRSRRGRGGAERSR